MGQDPGSAGAAMTSPEDLHEPPAATGDSERIEHEIEQTREQLGETVEALAVKTDVKAQAQHWLEDAKQTTSEKGAEMLARAKRITPGSVASAASQASVKARENPRAVTAAAAFFSGFAAARLAGRR